MQVFTISRPWEGAWESGWVARGGGGGADGGRGREGDRSFAFVTIHQL